MGVVAEFLAETTTVDRQQACSNPRRTSRLHTRLHGFRNPAQEYNTAEKARHGYWAPGKLRGGGR